MNKSQLVNELSERTGRNQRELRSIVEEMMNIIAEGIKKGERVSLQNFGTFKPRLQTSRLARNPRTGDTVMLIPRTIICFKCSPCLLDTLNEKEQDMHN
ncbi:HU family DNA-binding protein [Parabacteroides bouchesdurhonensis]|uniref:HU family DNA-binding protein n=1 Tax=Parabacteroides bouchesdurhonensis TaxID=1936995 RepID=UPI000C85A7BA|nr:HU family DNA-binding protein [Parabacteroides bouchesdurhonensis]RHJ90155.1 HU family DNA-binding protein [Bacteroides sp. AM07-16]